MKLNLEQIKQITSGAAVINEEDGVFSFNRFTPEQQELYRVTSQKFYDRVQITSGIKFYFKTNSKNLFIKIKTLALTTRKYFSLDVFVNNKVIGYIDNFSNEKFENDYICREFPDGEFDKNFGLGDGEKTVCVHLPWSVKTWVEEISVDDDAYVKEAKPEKKLLAFGDSITQGVDALRPSNKYITKIADLIGAQEFNKGIGGERFFPELALLKEEFVPDYITVAYGTNDWSVTDEETFKTKCKAFYANLRESYPGVKIFAITPIWRKDRDEYRPFGCFDNVEKYIKEIVAPMENVVFISGYDFVPKDEDYFADLRLHPNDKGFACYADNLYNKIKEHI